MNFMTNKLVKSAIWAHPTKSVAGEPKYFYFL